MATLFDRLKTTVYKGRAIAGKFGARTHTVSILVEHYTGQHTGEEHVGNVETPITEANGQPPRVEQMSEEEITVGNFLPGSLRVGPITPEFSGGGTSDELLFGALPKGSTRYVVITGPLAPNGAKYTIKGDRRDRALRRILIVSDPKPL